VANGKTILIVEDDLGLNEMLSAYFREQGYLVEASTSGEAALEWAKETAPSLVLLDIHLPGIDGYEVCRRLRRVSRCQSTPVIFLTERRKREERLAGLELGAVDYMTKPFDVQELGLRVRNTITRAGMHTLISPVTGFPERSVTREQLALMFDQPEWGIVLAGVIGLSDFADVYGFVAADDVARATGIMIQKAVATSGDNDFLGHISASDFMIITSPQKTVRLADQCRQQLDAAIPYFYPAADWQVLQESPDMARLTMHVSKHTSADGPISSIEDLRLALQSSL
jgi:CheY-like chemotaxis protein